MAQKTAERRIGAHWQPGVGTRFRVWAPRPRELELVLESAGQLAAHALSRDGQGYAEILISSAGPGTRYHYRLTGADGSRQLRPDPASRFQPEGVHGASEVVADTASEPPRPGRRWEDYVFYEMHTGTFTAEGSFDAACGDLERLAGLGVTALELMPVAQFPGTRNWGYDGVYPFAAQNSYGGPAALRRLVDACHRHGLATVLDVVYNHLGPEGNYLAEFAPYFTGSYHTPWGAALNFEGADSDPVREFFIQNALYWLDSMGFDALRLDAIHGIHDASAQPFLAELAAAVEARAQASGRRLYLIAESDLNDVRVLRPREAGGYGMRSQWSDDFHHALHALLTGERQGYYADFGSAAALATALREHFVFSGQYSAYRRRRHGNSAAGFARDRFVECVQNHDQIGNRAAGDRLTALLQGRGGDAALRLAAGVVILGAGTPLLFMGEEYGETAPFPYFVSHGDEDLVEQVRCGRRAEFAAGGDAGAVPDPQAAATFASARLRRELAATPAGAARLDWHRALLELRRRWREAAGWNLDVEAWSSEDPRLVTWRCGTTLTLAHFGAAAWIGSLPWPRGNWRCVLDSGAMPNREVASSGEVRLTLPGFAFAAFELLP